MREKGRKSLTGEGVLFPSPVKYGLIFTALNCTALNYTALNYTALNYTALAPISDSVLT